jgi:hypothetical protein
VEPAAGYQYGPGEVDRIWILDDMLASISIHTSHG